MSKERGEIVIGTLIIICLLIWPINWAINKAVETIAPPKKVEIPICKTDDGAVYFVVKDAPEKKK